MNLDCINNNGLRWIVIDHDDSERIFTEGDSIEEAWFNAALILQTIVNEADKILKERS